MTHHPQAVAALARPADYPASSPAMAPRPNQEEENFMDGATMVETSTPAEQLTRLLPDFTPGQTTIPSPRDGIFRNYDEEMRLTLISDYDAALKSKAIEKFLMDEIWTNTPGGPNQCEAAFAAGQRLGEELLSVRARTPGGVMFRLRQLYEVLEGEEEPNVWQLATIQAAIADLAEFERARQTVANLASMAPPPSTVGDRMAELHQRWLKAERDVLVLEDASDLRSPPGSPEGDKAEQRLEKACDDARETFEEIADAPSSSVAELAIKTQIIAWKYVWLARNPSCLPLAVSHRLLFGLLDDAGRLFGKIDLPPLPPVHRALAAE